MELPTWEHCSKANEAGTKLNPLEQFIYDTEPAIVEATWRAQLQAAIEFAIAESTKEPPVVVEPLKLYTYEEAIAKCPEGMRLPDAPDLADANVSVKLFYWDQGDGIDPTTGTMREVLNTVETSDGRRFHALKIPTHDGCDGCDLVDVVGRHAGLCGQPDFPCSPLERKDREDVIYKLVDNTPQPRWGDRAPGGGLAP